MSVKHDIFPAFVAIVPADDGTPYTDIKSAPLHPKTGRQVNKARIVVYNNHVIVAIDGDKGAKIVFEEGIQPNSLIKTSSNGEQDSFLLTASGVKIAYRKDTNCGCGSRLRSWNPYNVLHSKNDPTE